jgi:hypothetical protein
MSDGVEFMLFKIVVIMDAFESFDVVSAPVVVRYRVGVALGFLAGFVVAAGIAVVVV